jgi:hypothetical protein
LFQLEGFGFEDPDLELKEGERVIEKSCVNGILDGQIVKGNGRIGRLPKGRMRDVEDLLVLVLIEIETE